MDNAKRGKGATTQAMQAAPYGSVFVWGSPDIAYPRQLAQQLGRSDLTIVGPAWLQDRRYLGMELSGITVDPDAVLDERAWDGWYEAQTRVRKL